MEEKAKTKGRQKRRKGGGIKKEIEDNEIKERLKNEEGKGEKWKERESIVGEILIGIM